jgi:hypothetical protein
MFEWRYSGSWNEGSVAANPRGDPCVQQFNGKEDWDFSRDLLEMDRRTRCQCSVLSSSLSSVGSFFS